MLLLVVLTVRDLHRSQSALYLVLACISLTAVFLGFTPAYLQLPGELKIIIRFLDIPHLIFIWLFALSLFQRDFRMRPFHWAVGLVYCIPILLVRLAQFGVLQRFPFWWIVMVDLFSIALMIHLMAVALKGRADDLLEKRRASRIYFVIVIGFVAIASALSEIVFVGERRVFLETVKVLIICPAIIWTCYWLFSIKANALSFGADRKTPTAVSDLDMRDLALRERLEAEMQDNKAYLEQGISIAVIADRLGTTSHRLRTLINQSLGHENFSTFINGYRIHAIKAAFADPENAHVPILTIAMDFGFNSLSPFNRAFRASEGVTPSEYRRNLSPS